MLLLLPLSLASIGAEAGAAVAARCTSDLQCTLNGACISGACVCEPAWMGSPQCDVLSVRRAVTTPVQHPSQAGARS